MSSPPKPPAGWYPDPDGRGGQRYFDGTNWGPQAPPPSALATAPPPKNQMRSGKQIIIFTAIVLGFILFVAMCSSLSNKAEDSDKSRTESSSSISAAPTPTPTGPAKPAASFTTTPGPGGEEVTATFAIGDNFTEGLIKDGARFDTIEILKYAKQTYPNASQVTVKGSFPMKGQYGNTSTDVVLNVTYLRSTMQKINFDGVDKDQIWEIRDFGYVSPAFQP